VVRDIFVRVLFLLETFECVPVPTGQNQAPVWGM